MDKPKVTFLMLAYNKENEVERAIKSVLGQTEQNVALFIRDNGSTDRTRDICREYAGKGRARAPCAQRGQLPERRRRLIQ